MPNNMRIAGRKYTVGGARDKKNSYGDGGMDGSPQSYNMNKMAAGGGLKGFMAGGSVIDGLMDKAAYGNAEDVKSVSKMK